MDFQAIHDLAVEAAREAGAAVRGFYQDAYTIKDKGEDRKAPQAIESHLKMHYLERRYSFPYY